MKLKDKQLSELKEAVIKFNAELKKVPYGVKAPTFKSFEEEVNRIESYGISEYNRTIASLNRFKGDQIYTTKQGVNITLWEKDEIERGLKRINKKREKELKRYEPSSYKGTLGAINTANLKPRKNMIEEILPKNWDKYSESVISSSITPRRFNLQQYKDNYLKSVAENYGENSKLYMTVSNYSPEKIYKGRFESPVLSIEFTYDGAEDDFESEILEAWNNV